MVGRLGADDLSRSGAAVASSWWWMLARWGNSTPLISRYRRITRYYPSFPISVILLISRYPEIISRYRKIISRYRKMGLMSRYRELFRDIREMEFPITGNNSIFPDFGYANSRYWETISQYRELFPDIGNWNSRYREIISDIGKWWIKTQMAFHILLNLRWSSVDVVGTKTVE